MITVTDYYPSLLLTFADIFKNKLCCILIGGSAGGRIAIDFSITYPEHVTALILVGAALSGFNFTDHMLNRGWRNDFGETIEDMIEFWCEEPLLIAPENSKSQ